ncbi:MAG: hypothetical protein EXR66_02185 [Dehalococcoidia bacterium]|nr:hypothetical protein [Dehalococcoidia bacterium]
MLESYGFLSGGAEVSWPSARARDAAASISWTQASATRHDADDAPPVPDETRLLDALTHLDGVRQTITTLLDGFSADAPRHLQSEPFGDGFRYQAQAKDQALVRLFGTFAVEFGGKHLALRSGGKSLAVLKFLAASGSHTMPRDRIIEALRPDVPASVAASRLRTVLHGLRQMFPEGSTDADRVVSYDHGQYLLFPGKVLMVDADFFEEAWGRCQAYERHGKLNQAMDRYVFAESLYRGDFLEQDEYLDWTMLRREQLHDAYVALLMRLANLYLVQGDELGALARCHKVLRKDPCNEEAYRLVITAHGQRGERRAASRWYDLCERKLARGLNVSPSEATREDRNRTIGPDSVRPLADVG